MLAFIVSICPSDTIPLVSVAHLIRVLFIYEGHLKSSETLTYPRRHFLLCVNKESVKS